MKNALWKSDALDDSVSLIRFKGATSCGLLKGVRDRVQARRLPREKNTRCLQNHPRGFLTKLLQRKICVGKITELWTLLKRLRESTDGGRKVETANRSLSQLGRTKRVRPPA